MDTATPIILFPLYRWAGTSPEQLREHYVQVHAAIGKRLGVLWYETFLTVNPRGTGLYLARRCPTPSPS